MSDLSAITDTNDVKVTNHKTFPAYFVTWLNTLAKYQTRRIHNTTRKIAKIDILNLNITYEQGRMRKYSKIHERLSFNRLRHTVCYN